MSGRDDDDDDDDDVMTDYSLYQSKILLYKETYNMRDLLSLSLWCMHNYTDDEI